MSKKALLADICADLESQIQALARALGESIENASGQETRSEGKYDTRATEAAYLAEAQKKQVTTQRETLAILKNFDPPAFSIDDPVSLGALVEIEDDNDIQFYLLAPAGGGLSTTHLGCPITLVSPASPLYQNLLGKKLGDDFGLSSHRIMSVE